MNGKNPFKGIKYHHKETNFLLNGSIDDIWINNITKKNHCLIIKSTTKNPNNYLMMKSGVGIGDNCLFIHTFLEKIQLKCQKLE